MLYIFILYSYSGVLYEKSVYLFNKIVSETYFSAPFRQMQVLSNLFSIRDSCFGDSRIFYRQLVGD